MYDKIYEIIQSADDFVWGWGMIALLLGTHLFLTVRTGLIQRKTITKGIRLSVAIPKMPVIQHQNTAPGPPRAIAVPTPMIFPVPIVEASAVASAPN